MPVPAQAFKKSEKSTLQQGIRAPLEERVESLTALVQTLKLRQDGYHDFLPEDAFGADVGDSDAYDGLEEQDDFIPNLASVSPKQDLRAMMWRKALGANHETFNGPGSLSIFASSLPVNSPSIPAIPSCNGSDLAIIKLNHSSKEMYIYEQFIDQFL
ncbi:hypothetical protein SCAR479_05514 [Seiridium cardinale]|uniref:Uncharacterized protein n=1 Tax=Seiridium cardinale TaxID=138064 RepID=A0ABR2XVP5_9PEZI